MLPNRQWEMAGGQPGGDLREVDRGRGGGGRKAGSEQDASTRRPEAHAERAVDQPGDKAGQADEEELRIHSLKS